MAGSPKPDASRLTGNCDGGAASALGSAIESQHGFDVSILGEAVHEGRAALSEFCSLRGFVMTAFLG
ncbi:MAG: hypothetical protein AB7F51_11340, partial [Pseudorhodoplanes sp.]